MKLDSAILNGPMIAAVFLLSACGGGSGNNGISSDDGDSRVPQLSSDGRPGVVIRAPAPDFILGEALDLGVPALTQAILINGLVRVGSRDDFNNLPTVHVNGQVATVTPEAFGQDCPGEAPLQCFHYVAELSFEKGLHTITVSVSDVDGNTAEAHVGGTVDNCRRFGKDAGIAALIQNNPRANVLQSNRCHEIDGCSAYLYESDPFANSNVRNNPMGATSRFAAAPTNFGRGEVNPNSEYFVHGLQPTDLLPCNKHDVCYQTVNGMTQQQCDAQMLADMEQVCHQAYPEQCPDNLNSFECGLWRTERELCFGFAAVYFEVLSRVGGDVFQGRQSEYQHVLNIP